MLLSGDNKVEQPKKTKWRIQNSVFPKAIMEKKKMGIQIVPFLWKDERNRGFQSSPLNC